MLVIDNCSADNTFKANEKRKKYERLCQVGLGGGERILCYDQLYQVDRGCYDQLYQVDRGLL